jgi:Kef-type K+ transport system membrane component KefB
MIETNPELERAEAELAKALEAESDHENPTGPALPWSERFIIFAAVMHYLLAFGAGVAFIFTFLTWLEKDYGSVLISLCCLPAAAMCLGMGFALSRVAYLSRVLRESEQAKNTDNQRINADQ